jgi:hypothetical protein
MQWINQYSGKPYFITTQNYSSKQTARVKTYGDVISDYDFHPEAKCADSKGNVCGKQIIGLLQRRHISIGEIIAIGKEYLPGPQLLTAIEFTSLTEPKCPIAHVESEPCEFLEIANRGNFVNQRRSSISGTYF